MLRPALRCASIHREPSAHVPRPCHLYTSRTLEGTHKDGQVLWWGARALTHTHTHRQAQAGLARTWEL